MIKSIKRLTSASLAIFIGIGICLILGAVLGESPLHILKVLIQGSLGDLNNVGYTLFYATPLIFTGLSVALAFHGGLFNIGAEGQLYIGALTLTFFGILFPHLGLGFMSPFFGVLMAFLGGALWGGIAGVLKAYRGSHEVIVTILLNFISYALVGFCILHVIKNPLSQNPESSEIGSVYFLSGLGKLSEGSPVNTSFILALVVASFVWFLLFKTSWGFELRLTGSSPETARRAGIKVNRRIIQVMCLSGGLAGLVAVNEIMGAAHKFRDQFSSGFGFIGIAVALLGRNRPLGIILAALVFGALQKGSLELEIDTEKITRDLAGVMQALIILIVASESFWKRKPV